MLLRGFRRTRGRQSSEVLAWQIHVIYSKIDLNRILGICNEQLQRFFKLDLISRLRVYCRSTVGVLVQVASSLLASS